MADDRGFTRRQVIGIGAATLASTALSDLVLGPAQAAASPGQTPGIGYFSRFGVSEELIRAALGEALSRGGDTADLFFQHRVGNSYLLEDGAVNRAFANVGVGVGVRVVKGDQTGYGYTEDLALPALLACARTAAAIADGPTRDGPASLHVPGPIPDRYPLARAWEDVRPEEKLPLLPDLELKR